ncbi:hypothetical protein COV18_05355 [Candidatus Woesearchaeota archaeon CG10_big_fil_rev_8_21_14_0_10_37_12]|nr:MAG: hypothetical protein COV18_05355 [Candidatus Woesearchaeota archaeon CG10_big_fil_rev_8_21_14_0_10_37_12]
MGETQDPFNAEVLSRGLSVAVRQEFSRSVDTSWTEIQGEKNSDVIKRGHAAYLGRRTLHLRTAGLAVLTNHHKRAEIADNWAHLQDVYAQRVREQIVEGKADLEKELGTVNRNISELESIKHEHDELWEQVRGSPKPDREKLTKLAELSEHLDLWDSYAEDKARAERALIGINKAASDLDNLRHMEKHDRVHYRILSPEEINTQLKDNAYTGLPFEPFHVVTAEVADLFERKVLKPVVEPVSPGKLDEPVPAGNRKKLRLTEKPKELEALLVLKQVVDEYTTGSVFTSGQLKENVSAAHARTSEEDYLFGAGVLGSYLESAPDTFHVNAGKKGTARRFTKQNAEPISEAEFLGAISDHLRPSERAAVNSFYISKALDLLREQQKGYDNFTADDVVAATREYGFEVSRRAVGINLNEVGARSSGLEITRDPSNEKRIASYRFAEVKPTEKQIEAIGTAVARFGYDAFSVDDLCKGATGLNGAMIPRVVDHVLSESYDALGLRQINGDQLRYQKVERPDSAAEQAARARPDPIVDELV